MSEYMAYVLTACINCASILHIHVSSDFNKIICPKCKKPIHGEKEEEEKKVFGKREIKDE